MSKVNGQMTTCERCGEQIFRKCVGEGETDGGYTRWNNFEPLPDGWEIVHVPKEVDRYGCVMVCPKCSSKWKQVLVSHYIAGTQLAKAEEAHNEA